jgi:hypothetical protein
MCSLISINFSTMPTTTIFFGKLCGISYHQGWSMTLEIGITFGAKHVCLPMRYFNSSAPAINHYYYIVAKWFHSSDRPLVFDIEVMHQIKQVPSTMTYPTVIATTIITKSDPKFPRNFEPQEEDLVIFEGQIDSFVRSPDDDVENKDKEKSSKFLVDIHLTYNKAFKGIYPYIKPKANVYVLGYLHAHFAIEKNEQHLTKIFVEAKRFEFTNIDKQSTAVEESTSETLAVGHDNIIFMPVSTPTKRKIINLIQDDEEDATDDGTKENGSPSASFISKKKNRISTSEDDEGGKIKLETPTKRRSPRK